MTAEINENQPRLDHFGKCPKCGADWDAGDVFTTLRPQDWCKHMSDEQLMAEIHASYAPPYKFSRLIGVELPYNHPQHYDGVSYWMCPDCKHQWPRFGIPQHTKRTT